MITSTAFFVQLIFRHDEVKKFTTTSTFFKCYFPVLHCSWTDVYSVFRDGSGFLLNTNCCLQPKDGEDLPDDGSSSSTSYTVMDSDKQKVQQLRDWIAANDFRDLSQVLEDGVPGEITKLEDVESGKFFNLVCQVRKTIRNCLLTTG